MKILKSLLLIPAVFAITTVAQAQAAMPKEVCVDVAGQTIAYPALDVGCHDRLTFRHFCYSGPSIYKACCSVCSKTGNKLRYEAFINHNGQTHPCGSWTAEGATPCFHTFYITTCPAGAGLKDAPDMHLDGNGYFTFHHCGGDNAKGASQPEEAVTVQCTFSPYLTGSK